jgi:large repetitive protein
MKFLQTTAGLINVATIISITISGAIITITLVDSSTITLTYISATVAQYGYAVLIQSLSSSTAQVFEVLPTTTPTVSITSIVSSSGPTTGGTIVNITGTGFVPWMQVTIGGVTATNVRFLSTTCIQCIVPAGTAGTVDVSVADGSYSATLSNGWTYLS